MFYFYFLSLFLFCLLFDSYRLHPLNQQMIKNWTEIVGNWDFFFLISLLDYAHESIALHTAKMNKPPNTDTLHYLLSTHPILSTIHIISIWYTVNDFQMPHIFFFFYLRDIFWWNYKCILHGFSSFTNTPLMNQIRE